ncbi:BTB POZ domain-containing protein [Klebsormidium nitens]|uniref:BTB POZ domain-containing protein n=1 Tax=Klebsormidium nitens TaxID=105231 RepID=A0A1Y1HKI9_KLENI|nr:BTB POZ domain-containing protein [Klebsormidium nitens]|eukprot:GAQ79105.1 BTB POZ domain-containing protein [Klebsormidium nitens]
MFPAPLTLGWSLKPAREKAVDMALSLDECFDVQKYSTHVLCLKYPGGDAKASDFKGDADQVLKKGKRKRGTDAADCMASQNVHVNAAILATKSEVLDKLLNSEMQGSSSTPSVMLHSKEEADLMCTLLKFCYNSDLIDEIADEKEKVLALLVLADKFRVTECFPICADILETSLDTIEDASMFLSLPDFLQQQACLQRFVECSRKTLEKKLENLDELFTSGKHVSLSLEVLKIALESNVSRINSENTCFCIVWDWIEENCKGPSARKAALGELLTALKFGHMTGDFLLAISARPDMTRPSAAGLIKEALRFRMGQSSENPGSFDLSKISARPSNTACGLHRPWVCFEGVAESTLVALELGENVKVPPIFVDGYLFDLQIQRQSEDECDFSIHVNPWKQLQTPEDKVSLKSRLATGAIKETLWKQKWKDTAVTGRGYRSPNVKLLASSGKSVQRKYLAIPERMLIFYLAIEWNN